MNPSDFSSNVNIFSILRNSSDDSIPMIRLLNLHFGDISERNVDHFKVWQQFAHSSFECLVDLSQSESLVLQSLASDVLLCDSVIEMIKVVFPISIVFKFMNESKGILHYIYLLQSSIEYCSHIHPLTSDLILYRAFKCGGVKLIPLYESMIEEVIVWSSFTSTSTDRDSVIEHFITGNDSILFEILLHPGDAAVCIEDHSEVPSESEVLIAASSGFIVESVELVDVEIETANGVRELKIPQVKRVIVVRI
jgi:hypothetical protein